MQVKLQLATPEDAEAIAALRNAVSDDLTFTHGRGGWTRHHTTAEVLRDLRNSQLFVALHRDDAVATLVLSSTKPTSIDLKYFTKAKRPSYLTALALSPELPRQDVARACIEQAIKLARKARADAIFTEAHDHASAGAGERYRQAGFREAGRAKYRDVPLIYYELML